MTTGERFARTETALQHRKGIDTVADPENASDWWHGEGKDDEQAKHDASSYAAYRGGTRESKVMPVTVPPEEKST